MRILITGVPGFVSTYLAEFIASHHGEAEVWGLRWTGAEANQELENLMHLVPGDLTDPASLDRVMAAARPEIVFHLAAASSAAQAWEDPAGTLKNNAVGQINLFEAMRKHSLQPVTVIASSADVYGRPETNPTDETSPLRPVSPYGVSKATQELVAFQYHQAYRIPVLCLRLYNHTGPGQPARFVASSFARQIAGIEKGQLPPRIDVGNLEVEREFMDVRDVVRAYWLAAERCLPGNAYNVCSGRIASIREVLDLLLEMADADVAVQADPGLIRPADIPIQHGANHRFISATGWQPKIPLVETLKDLLGWWRNPGGKGKT